MSRLSGEPIGFTVLNIFVIDRNTILTVCYPNVRVFAIAIPSVVCNVGAPYSGG